MTITQHYYEGQARHLAEWTEARKRERRLFLVPKTETCNNIEIAKLNRCMALVGVPVGICCVIGIVVLLIVHFGWWTIPALVGAAGVGISARKVGWWL